MIEDLNTIGASLEKIYNAREEDTQGRVFFSFECYYQKPNTPKITVGHFPTGHHLSAHEKMALQTVPNTLIKTLQSLTNALDTIPLFHHNKARPCLKMELVGSQTDDPLGTRGVVQGAGGITIQSHMPIIAQSAWLMPIGRQTHSYTEWMESEIQRWASIAHRHVACDSPYWYIYSQSKHTKKCPAIKAEKEEDALALYTLLHPHLPVDITLTGFKREGDIPASLEPWT